MGPMSGLSLGLGLAEEENADRITITGVVGMVAFGERRKQIPLRGMTERKAKAKADAYSMGYYWPDSRARLL